MSRAEQKWCVWNVSQDHIASNPVLDLHEAAAKSLAKDWQRDSSCGWRYEARPVSIPQPTASEQNWGVYNVTEEYWETGRLFESTAKATADEYEYHSGAGGKYEARRMPQPAAAPPEGLLAELTAAGHPMPYNALAELCKRAAERIREAEAEVVAEARKTREAQAADERTREELWRERAAHEETKRKLAEAAGAAQPSSGRSAVSSAISDIIREFNILTPWDDERIAWAIDALIVARLSDFEAWGTSGEDGESYAEWVKRTAGEGEGKK